MQTTTPTVTKLKRTRNVSKVMVYYRVKDTTDLVPVRSEVHGPHADIAKAKAALRESLNDAKPSDLPTTFVFVRVLGEVTPKVESVTRVTL